MTDSSQEVDFPFFGFGELPNLAEVRFANWVTGPDGVFKFTDDFSEGSLTSIYAPRLEGNSNLNVQIRGNPNLAEVDLSALKAAGSVSILNNPALQTLSAPNLVDGGSVCIGDDINQPSLDADLSSLVTGSFAVFSPCYGRTDPFTNQLNATTVCGVEPNGLFTTEGCQN
mmetsp:Transcript_5416/g.13659  ORF Transcript_5416/g.13659 Transcript_5416/m.13659 type:complete len:170 (+) Transcript_5416:3-512(+)